MTDKIPESVMKEAQDLFEDPHFRPFRSDNCIREVAKALLARDQRAAEIARHVPTPADVQDPMLRLGYISASQAIANAILSYDEAQQ